MKRFFLIPADYEEEKKSQKRQVGQKHRELVRINCDNSASLMELCVR